MVRNRSRNRTAKTAELEFSSRRSLAECLRTVQDLVSQLKNLHQRGQAHLRVCGDTVEWDRTGKAILLPPEPSSSFGGPNPNSEHCPPELRRPQTVVIPSEIEAARRIIEKAGCKITPEEIDLFQLGCFLCRLVTGDSVDAYLQNSKEKSTVPIPLRQLIDQTVNFKPPTNRLSLNEFADRIDKLDLRKSEFPEHLHKSATSPNLPATPESDTGPGGPLLSKASRKQAAIPFQRLGHFEILDHLGHGGMGDVYLGYERSLDRRVAIKVLPAKLSHSEDFIRRFYAEATAAARLIHPSIIQIYFIGEDQGFHFFAMQFVEGESLAERLSKQQTVSLHETLTIIGPLLSGLGEAHRLGLIHRDIKPGNILLDNTSQRPFLADFGLVKSTRQSEALTETGIILGTMDYISPEQAQGYEVDPRSDLYSLGVVLFRMLGGRLPFYADNPTAMLFQHVHETPPKLSQICEDISESVSRLVDRLLAKNPNDRYPDVEAVLSDLQSIWEQEGLASTDHVFLTNQEVNGVPSGQTCERSSNRCTATLIAVPSFDSMPSLPTEIEQIPPTGWWSRLKNRCVDFFFVNASDVYETLQNAQQELQKSIEDYERQNQNWGMPSRKRIWF